MSLGSFLSPTCSTYSCESIFCHLLSVQLCLPFTTLSLYQIVLSSLWVIKNTREIHFILNALFSCDEIHQCKSYLICREFLYCNHRNGPFMHVPDVFTCMKNLYAWELVILFAEKMNALNKWVKRQRPSCNFNKSTWLPSLQPPRICLGHWGMFISITLCVTLLGISWIKLFKTLSKFD